MEINGDPPPLIWPQFESTAYNRRSSSTFVPAMIGAISATVFLLFAIFVVPPILTTTSQILQPSSVKRGWDSINVVLVVFAILCGVLARRNDDGSSSSSSSTSVLEEEEEAVTSGEGSKISSSVVSEEWFNDVYDADRLKIYESFSNRSFSPSLPVTGSLNLRRSSTSYPDLRNGVSRDTVDRQFRFHDDFEIDKYRSQDSRSYHPVLSRSKTEIEELEHKEVSVDKFVVTPPQQPPEASTPPPPPPPPPPAVEVSQKPRRTHRSVKNRDVQENVKRSDIHSAPTRFKRSFHPPPPSPPPPPPPPQRPLITATPPRKQGTLQRRKSNAAKEIKMVFASLYNQGKKKKKLQKSKRKERIEYPVVVETVIEPQPQYQSSFPPPSPPPPPPPPPPPLRSASQSVFYGLFKKGVKSKKIHSVPTPPPPPPPRKIQLAPQTPPRSVKSGRPPRPTKQTNINEESYQGYPLIHTTPPPPPPPPFSVPPLKFVVSGDFAKIRSNQSSRCSSPEREVIDLGWGLELTQPEGGVETNVAGGMTGFCPSPDVNTKADNFIARLRDEWRLDKINSVKGKRRMSSV